MGILKNEGIGRKYEGTESNCLWLDEMK